MSNFETCNIFGVLSFSIKVTRALTIVLDNYCLPKHPNYKHLLGDYVCKSSNCEKSCELCHFRLFIMCFTPAGIVSNLTTSEKRFCRNNARMKY